MEAIDKTVENAINRLQPLKAPARLAVSEVLITFACSACGAEAERKASGVLYCAGERRTYECGECEFKRREIRFLSQCPPLYQASDESRLPRAQMAEAMRWEYNPRGVVFMGDTGKGKSRIAWRMLKRILCEDKQERGFMWFDCIAFGHDIARHYHLEDAETWLDKVAAIPLLFFDDLGKLKLTERAETELFGVIERRCAAQLPIIATTNDTGDSLAARMTENRGPALIRRLREFCDIITF